MTDTIPTRPIGPAGEGRVLQRGVGRVVAYPLLDARSAVAGALRAYLASLTFTVYGDQAPNRDFKLMRVDREWPDPQKALDVPLCVVLDPEPGKQDSFNLTPTPIEDTWDRDAGTVLFKTAELVVTLTADFWAGNEAERQAIAAALPSAFSPSEDQYGVFIETSPAYWSLPARLTYLDAQRMDDAGSIYPRERRWSVTFRGELAVVDKRSAVEMDPSFTLDVVPVDALIPPVDPPP